MWGALIWLMISVLSFERVRDRWLEVREYSLVSDASCSIPLCRSRSDRSTLSKISALVKKKWGFQAESVFEPLL